MTLIPLSSLPVNRTRVGDIITNRAFLPSGIEVFAKVEIFHADTKRDYFGWALPIPAESVKVSFGLRDLHKSVYYPGDATGWTDLRHFVGIEGAFDIGSIFSNATDANNYQYLLGELYNEPLGVINCTQNPYWDQVPFKICSRLPLEEKLDNATTVVNPPTVQRFSVADQRLNLSVNFLDSVSCGNTTGTFFSEQYAFLFTDSTRNLSGLATLSNLSQTITSQYRSPDRYGVIRLSGIASARVAACNATEILFDPDLTMLFLSSPTPPVSNEAAPTNGTSGLSSQDAVNVVAIVVPVCIVVALVVAIAIAAVVHPGFRSAIFPFAKSTPEKYEAATIDEDTPPPESTTKKWKQVSPSKPTN